MKKSILTIALAVMLVFAFTACNNTAPTSPLFGKQIQGVSLVSAPDYVAGETLDASAVTLKVNFDDNTSMNFKGSELGLTMSGALAAGSNAATATIADLEYTVNINAYAIEGFNIDISTIKADTVVRDATTVPSNGATIDVVYNGGKAKTAPEAIVSADTTLQGMVNIPVEAFGIDWDLPRLSIKRYIPSADPRQSLLLKLQQLPSLTSKLSRPTKYSLLQVIPMQRIPFLQ